MPILLTTPYKGFAEVKIVAWKVRVEPPTQRGMFMTFQYGDTVAGAWVPGDIIPDERHVKNIEQLTDGETEIRAANPAYDTLSASATALATDEVTPGDGGYKIAVATARELYQYAIDTWPAEFAGTIQ